jgi:hypothetical protein
MSIQMFDRDSPQFEKENMTPQDRLKTYLLEFARVAPTEGVTLPAAYRDSRWPGLPKAQPLATGEDEVAAANNSNNDDEENNNNNNNNNADDSSSSFNRILGTNLMSFQVMVDNLHITFDPESEEFGVRVAVPQERSEVELGHKLPEAMKKFADEPTSRLVVEDEATAEKHKELAGFDSEEKPNEDVAMEEVKDDAAAPGDEATAAITTADADEPAVPDNVAEAINQAVEELKEEMAEDGVVEESVEDGAGVEPSTVNKDEDVQMEESAE